MNENIKSLLIAFFAHIGLGEFATESGETRYAIRTNEITSSTTRDCIFGAATDEIAELYPFLNEDMAEDLAHDVTDLAELLIPSDFDEDEDEDDFGPTDEFEGSTLNAEDEIIARLITIEKKLDAAITEVRSASSF